MILFKKQTTHESYVIMYAFMSTKKSVEEFIWGCEYGWGFSFILAHFDLL